MYDLIKKTNSNKDNNTDYSINEAKNNGRQHVTVVDNRPSTFHQNRLQNSVTQYMHKKALSSAMSPIQRDTEIQSITDVYDYNDGSKQSEIVGSHMLAYLDPKDPKKGSEPGTGVQSGLMGYLKGQGFKRMIRGHLLNAQLGGLGIASNLYPITSQANSKHKNHVENKAKDFITKAKGKGKRLKYELDVSKQGSWKPEKPDVNFDCQISWEGEQNKLVDESISSNPESGKTGKGVATKNTGSLGFKNANLPKGWGGSGKGYNANNEYHQKTLKVTSITKKNPNSNNIAYNLGQGSINDFPSLIEYARDFIADYDFDDDNEEELYLGMVDNTESEPQKYAGELIELLKQLGATF
jgi:hypothetical protein